MDVSSSAFRDSSGCTEADGGPAQGTAAASGPEKPFSVSLRRIPPARTAGFTLIELLVTLAVVVVLLTLGAPTLQAMAATNRLASGVNNLVGTLALARSEAVKRNREVVVCQSNGGPSCSHAGDWQNGWRVYVDHNGNRRQDAGEPTLGQSGGLAEGLQLTYRAFGSRRYLVYYPTGMTRTNGTFTFCDPDNPARARAVVLTKSGRPRRSKVGASGQPLSCGP